MRIRPRVGNERQQSQCAHPETTATINFGLARVLCLSCGRVEMRYLERAATVGLSPGNEAGPVSKPPAVGE